MPQLDLDHLFCVGRARGSVACETDAAAVQGGGDVSASARADDGHAPAEPPPSAQLRARDGVGVGVLAELFGAALRRDGSTKGSSNPKAAAEAATRRGAPRADSRRSPAAAAGKTAVVIGVLPAAGKVVAKERRGRGRAWRRPAGGGGARVFASDAAAGPEPVSPKVSCFGAVLSERSAAAALPGQGKQRGEEEEGEERSGCCASLAAALRGLCCRDNALEGHLGASESNSKAAAAELPQRVAVMSPPPPVAVAVAGIGDLKRLASRRWPETMAVAAEARGSV